MDSRGFNVSEFKIRGHDRKPPRRSRMENYAPQKNISKAKYATALQFQFFTGTVDRGANFKMVLHRLVR